MPAIAADWTECPDCKVGVPFAWKVMVRGQTREVCPTCNPDVQPEVPETGDSLIPAGVTTYTPTAYAKHHHEAHCDRQKRLQREMAREIDLYHRAATGEAAVERLAAGRNLRRTNPGRYEGTVLGRKVEVVRMNPREWGDKGRHFWNVFVDGECNDCAPNLKEAFALAEDTARLRNRQQG